MRAKVTFPRELLLLEVERWCGDHACNARTRLSLTKAEARAYRGFECSRCERWNKDALTERDVPEWWEELQAASPEGLRPQPGALKGDGPGEVVARLSGARKELGASEELAGEEGKGGDSF
ncbi:MAG TPA: hypothetical protein VF591_13575 [Pyrinomonadaceae bacterium]